MKQRRYIYITMLVIIVSLAVFKDTLVVGMFRSRTLVNYQLFLTVFGTPGDYREPLIEMNMGKGTAKATKFICKYPGDKYFSLATAKQVISEGSGFGQAAYKFKMKLDMKICHGEQVVWKSTIDHPVGGPYWGNNEMGYVLADMNCPKDIPMDDELTFTIDMIERDKAFDSNPVTLKLHNRIRE